ncbi:MAG: carboxylating nicotinate-nucleotide diphosphorylase [Clostridia bacterium]
MNFMNLQIDKIIKRALLEDMPYGDISTESLFTGEEMSAAGFIAKEDGVAAGLFVAARVFEIVDADTKFTAIAKEGDAIKKGDIIAEVYGRTVSLLKAERLSLNLLQRMCGIASKTRKMAELIKDTGARLTDTRKTTPNLRILEKYAVRAGGGINHRFSLSDAVMLKDNHIKAAGGIKTAIEKVRKSIPHTMTVEVEVSTVGQAQEAADAGADIIMLDNMQRDEMILAVKTIGGKALVEISGNITESNIKDRIIPGIDIVSSGSLTHSVEAMDISMKFM